MVYHCWWPLITWLRWYLLSFSTVKLLFLGCLSLFLYLLYSLEVSMCSPNAWNVERYALTLSRVQYLHKLFVILLQRRFMSFPLFIYLLIFLPLYSILAIQDAPGSCCVFPAPVLESATCPRDPSSFYWTMLWENVIWVLGVLLLQDHLREQLYVCISSVQSLSRVRLFATPWITAHQASLSITNSRSSVKPMSIESVMPSSHLILYRPLLLLPPVPPSIRVFSNESTRPMRWPKYWSCRFSISPSSEHPDLL